VATTGVTKHLQEMGSFGYNLIIVTRGCCIVVTFSWCQVQKRKALIQLVVYSVQV